MRMIGNRLYLYLNSLCPLRALSSHHSLLQRTLFFILSCKQSKISSLVQELDGSLDFQISTVYFMRMRTSLKYQSPLVKYLFTGFVWIVIMFAILSSLRLPLFTA